MKAYVILKKEGRPFIQFLWADENKKRDRPSETVS